VHLSPSGTHATAARKASTTRTTRTRAAPAHARATHRRHRIHPRWNPGRTWLRQAACIRWHESRGNWRIDTGSGYYGAYQFLVTTWRSVGGRGYPNQAPPREQSYRAWRVWLRDGHSWREWGTAGSCGLR
jgi:hypothetical protein